MKILAGAMSIAVTALALAIITCPAGTAHADPTYDLKCTNMINYAGDPRSNAEINGIGWSTGTCPAPIPGAR